MSKRTSAFPFLLGACLLPWLASCGDEYTDESPPPLASSPVTPFPPARAPTTHGVFAGTLAANGVAYATEAILTKDGAVRLSIGAVSSGSTAGQTSPPVFTQFVGTMRTVGNSADGRGVVLGEQCGPTQASRYCSERVSGGIQVSFENLGHIMKLVGEIRLDSAPPGDAWTLELWDLNLYYASRARIDVMAAQYSEFAAAFADDDTVVNIDRTGQIFFQSPGTACVGNGMLRVHADGAHDVYDVTLNIQNCDSAHAFLNGDFEGLVSSAPSNTWNYDFWLHGWLSKRGVEAASPAISMLGASPGNWDY